MLNFRTILAAVLTTLSPCVASATVFTFHDTEMSALSTSPVSFSFALDTATANNAGSGTTFDSVVIDQNGKLLPASRVGATFTTNLSSSFFYLVDTSAVPFYSGSGTGITFNTGTFAIADGLTDGEGTLTISASPVSSAPEPATWTSLLIGSAIALTACRFSRSSRSSIRTAA